MIVRGIAKKNNKFTAGLPCGPFMERHMKTIATVIIAAVLAAGTPGAAYAAETVAVGEASAAKPKKTETVTFSVSIHCANCGKKIRENVSFEKGVKDLDVDVQGQTVKVTYDPRKTDVEKLRKAIERLGYSAAVAA